MHIVYMCVEKEEEENDQTIFIHVYTRVYSTLQGWQACNRYSVIGIRIACENTVVWVHKADTR